jgi:hypothetical protein
VSRFPIRIFATVGAGVAGLAVVLGLVVGGDGPDRRDSIRLQTPLRSPGSDTRQDDGRGPTTVPRPTTTVRVAVPVSTPPAPADDAGTTIGDDDGAGDEGGAAVPAGDDDDAGAGDDVAEGDDDDAAGGDD